MKNNLIETIMGAVVLTVAGFFLVFAYTSSGYQKTNGATYVARFDRVDGINVGSEVRMSGVKVGTVDRMRIDPKTFLAEINFSVDKAIKLPKDSSAEIISGGLLGDKYVALVPGGEEEILEPGAEVTYTQASVSLEAMIGQLIFSKKEEKTDPKP